MSFPEHTPHISQQILDPNITIGTATTGRVYSKARIVYIKKPSLKAINLLKSKLALLKQQTPSPPSPPPPSPPSSLRSLFTASLSSLKLPTRLASFITFTSRFNAPYATAFYPIYKHLAKLEIICLHSHLRSKSEEEDEIWRWIESHYPGVFLGDYEEGKRGLMERIILETMVGEVQVGVLMGIGILRDEMIVVDEEVGEDGMRAGDKEKLQKWIKEGEDFIVELEGMKRLIGERETEMRYMKEVVRVYGGEEVGSECISEGSGGTFKSAEADMDGSPPPIPRRSSKREVPIEGLK